MAPPNKDELIQQFCSFTSAQPSEAENALGAHDWDVEAAVATWFTSQEDEEEEVDAGMADDAAPAPEQVPGGGRTLGGEGVASRYVPPTTQPATSGPSRGAGPSGRVQGGAGPRTLRDIQGGGAHAGHGHDDDDDDEDDVNQDMFAGGEKSGLAVQNPGSARDHIESMLSRARRNIPRPGGDEEEQPRSRFTGRGVTLGGEGTESRVIDDPSAATPASARPPPRVQRILHLWADGFSVDDGDLFRYDDPANSATLAMINSGRAPLDLLNVEPNQEVDLQLDNQKDTKFVQPKKKYKPFSGTGQRLGSPTPGVSGQPSTASHPIPPPTAAATPSASTGAAPSTDVNESEPTVQLQIRLGDGTQLRTRFNTTHTIGDVYHMVDRAHSVRRPYVLMTTFPSKPLEDKAAVIGELAELKKGGVVVQKWT